VRRLMLIAAGFLCLAGGSYFLSAAWGQGKKDGAAEDVPHRIGLIDMIYVLDNYEKSKYDREELKAAAQEAQAKLDAKRKNGQELQAQLKTFAEGSPEFEQRLAHLRRLEAEFKTDTESFQREFARQHAKNVHTAYLEIQDAVKKFCDYHKFTLVIQFNRNEPNSSDPKKNDQIMNQVVVYHRKKDDLSKGVTDYLNEKYLRDSGGEKPAADAKPPKKDKKVAPAEATSGGSRKKTAE